MTLPTTIAVNDAGHAALHNETNTQVNTNTTDIATKQNAAQVSAAIAAATLPTSTTAALADIANAVNTTGKYAGKTYYNTTTKKLATADGSTAAAVWVDATGATSHTPA